MLNLDEAAALTGASDPLAAATALREGENAAVVVIKLGSTGALIFDGSSSTFVYAYRSEAVDKIGSGDVFSSSFYHFWRPAGHERLDGDVLAGMLARMSSRQ